MPSRWRTRPASAPVGSLRPAATGQNYQRLKGLVRDLRLHTVCESAACPNVGDCWNRLSATFMILGNVCTRRCGFCAVQKGPPETVDYDEPRRVADAIAQMGLRHAVVTSVNRDDRSDGGAELFAMTIRAIRERLPDCTVEVLVPDFQGSRSAMDIVLDARPNILNHNIETVPRLYRTVRVGSDYRRSLMLLRHASSAQPAIPTKSGIMLGLGESDAEIYDTLGDLREYGVEILTVGQYLRPPPDYLAIQKFYTRRSSNGFAGRAASLASGMSSRERWCVILITQTRASSRCRREVPPTSLGRLAAAVATSIRVLVVWPVSCRPRARTQRLDDRSQKTRHPRVVVHCEKSDRCDPGTPHEIKCDTTSG